MEFIITLVADMGVTMRAKELMKEMYKHVFYNGSDHLANQDIKQAQGVISELRTEPAFNLAINYIDLFKLEIEAVSIFFCGL
jgi:hypothetical protein